QGGVIAGYTIAMGATFAILRWLPRSRARADQKVWTDDMKIDLIFSILVVPIVFVGLDVVEERWIGPSVRSVPWLASYRAATASLPVAIQIVLALLLKEFLGYWRHRAMHWGPLWTFHAIHHAPEEMDFATSSRFHPAELLGTWSVAILAALILNLDGVVKGVLFSVIGMNHNFGVGILTLFDVLFGTFHLPPGECPTVAGTDARLPKSVWGLLR